MNRNNKLILYANKINFDRANSNEMRQKIFISQLQWKDVASEKQVMRENMSKLNNILRIWFYRQEGKSIS